MSTIDPTSLDSLETTIPSPHPPTPLQRRFFGGAEPTWQHLISCLHKSPDSKLNKRAIKLSECCKFPAIKADEHGRAVPTLARCKDRICPICSRTRGFAAAEKAEGLIGAMNAPRFLTLTLKHSKTPLTHQVDRLMDSFRNLRKSDLWKAKVTGGIYTLELTRNKKTDEWHPHLHVIFDGKFMLHSHLKDEWSRITGDSNIVDIRAVHDRKAAAYYIAEYISKAPGIGQWSDKHVCEFATALHGRRLINTIGNLHGKKLDPKPELPKLDHTKFFPSICEIKMALQNQNEKAITAMALSRNLGGIWCRLFDLKGPTDGENCPDKRDEYLCQMTDVLTSLYDELFPHSRQNHNRMRDAQPPPPPKPKQTTLQWDQIPY